MPLRKPRPSSPPAASHPPALVASCSITSSSSSESLPSPTTAVASLAAPLQRLSIDPRSSSELPYHPPPTPRARLLKKQRLSADDLDGVRVVRAGLSDADDDWSDIQRLRLSEPGADPCVCSPPAMPRQPSPPASAAPRPSAGSRQTSFSKRHASFGTPREVPLPYIPRPSVLRTPPRRPSPPILPAHAPYPHHAPGALGAIDPQRSFGDARFPVLDYTPPDEKPAELAAHDAAMDGAAPPARPTYVSMSSSQELLSRFTSPPPPMLPPPMSGGPMATSAAPSRPDSPLLITPQDPEEAAVLAAAIDAQRKGKGRVPAPYYPSSAHMPPPPPPRTAAPPAAALPPSPVSLTQSEPRFMTAHERIVRARARALSPSSFGDNPFRTFALEADDAPPSPLFSGPFTSWSPSSSAASTAASRRVSAPEPDVYAPSTSALYVPDRTSTVSLPLPLHEPLHTLPAFVSTQPIIPEHRALHAPTPRAAPATSHAAGAGARTHHPSIAETLAARTLFDDMADRSTSHWRSSLGSTLSASSHSSAGSAVSPGVAGFLEAQRARSASSAADEQAPMPPPDPPRLMTPPPGGAADAGAAQGAGAATHHVFLCKRAPPPEVWIAVETGEERYRLLINLPGCERDAITISARRRRVLQVTADSWWQLGGAHFERRVKFGYDADLGGVSAEFDGDLLLVSIPRRHERHRRMLREDE